jgi:molybdopterin/thiamine biosynthesis adenylyltransferase
MNLRKAVSAAHLPNSGVYSPPTLQCDLCLPYHAGSRQVIHTQARLGQHKAESAAAAVAALNPAVAVEPHLDGLTPANAMALVARYDVVLDCCDNAATRYLLSDACAAVVRRLQAPGSVKCS